MKKYTRPQYSRVKIAIQSRLEYLSEAMSTFFFIIFFARLLKCNNIFQILGSQRPQVKDQVQGDEAEGWYGA